MTVKFEDSTELSNHCLFCYPGHIIAAGTITDSITFTSNSSNPQPGIWNGIRISDSYDSSQFNYCNFKYAYSNNFTTGWGTGKIKNCNFTYNNTGIWQGFHILIDSCNFKNNNYGIYKISYSAVSNSNISNNTVGINCHTNTWITNCIIDSNQTGVENFHQDCLASHCIVRNNQYGITTANTTVYPNNTMLISNSIIDSNAVAGIVFITGGGTKVDSCEIKYNGTGIIDSGGVHQNKIIRNKIENNSVGISLGTASDPIFCNKICNNTVYGLRSFMTSNANVHNNYWCTPDSISTQAIIFDGNDSTGLGFINFLPFSPDTAQCYDCANIIMYATAICASDSFTNNGSATAFIINSLPPYNYSWNTFPVQTTQTATGLNVGYYTVCITDSMLCSVCSSVFVCDSTNPPLNVNEILSDKSFTLFPNPVFDNMTLLVPDFVSKAELRIFSVLGELKYSSTIVQPKTDIDISTLSQGIYIAEIATGNNISRRKFIKQKNIR